MNQFFSSTLSLKVFNIILSTLSFKFSIIRNKDLFSRVYLCIFKHIYNIENLQITFEKPDRVLLSYLNYLLYENHFSDFQKYKNCIQKFSIDRACACV